jgi:hypothetical protein
LNPVQIAFTPNGEMAYVANYASQSVTPIRLADGQAGPAIAAGKIPTRLAVSPDSTTVYVLDSNVFGEMGLEMPFGAQVRMLSRILFSALVKKPLSWRGQVIPIRVATNSAGKPIKVGRLPMAYRSFRGLLEHLDRVQRRHAPARPLYDVLSTISVWPGGRLIRSCRCGARQHRIVRPTRLAAG